MLAAAALWVVSSTPASAATTASAATASRANPDGLGIQAGKIKHVWLIIFENKSYDATFTGLNNNTYLWKTLPSQGVLLKNYYGTGHFSLDNYVSLVSGQATQPDTQADCPFYDQFTGHVDIKGSLRTNPNYGQMASAQGPNAAAGTNGCVYPKSVPTLFNQFDAAHVSWKGYAQDLGNPDTGSPRARRRDPVLRRSLRRARRRPGSTKPAEPGQRERDRPVRAQALPVPVVRVDPAVR